MLRGGQGIKRQRNIPENFNQLSRVHERYRRQTDRQMTDGRAIAYSERVSSRSLMKMVCVNNLCSQSVTTAHLLMTSR